MPPFFSFGGTAQNIASLAKKPKADPIFGALSPMEDVTPYAIGKHPAGQRGGIKHGASLESAQHQKGSWPTPPMFLWNLIELLPGAGGQTWEIPAL